MWEGQAQLLREGGLSALLSGRAWEAEHGVQAVGAQVGVPREAAPLCTWTQRQRGGAGGATVSRR